MPPFVFPSSKISHTTLPATLDHRKNSQMNRRRTRMRKTRTRTKQEHGQWESLFFTNISELLLPPIGKKGKKNTRTKTTTRWNKNQQQRQQILYGFSSSHTAFVLQIFFLFGWKAWNPEFSRQAYAADSSSDVTSKTRLQPLILLWGSIPILNEKCAIYLFFPSNTVAALYNYSNCIQQQSKFSLIFITQSYGFFLFIIFWIFFGPHCATWLCYYFHFSGFFAPTTQPRTFIFYFLKTIWGWGGGLLCDVGTLAFIHKNILSNLNVGSNF